MGGADGGAAVVAGAVVMVVVLLTLFPGLVRDPNSKARTQANQTLEIEFYYTDGDLFAWLPGKVRPPDENVLEAKYTISWDANGFRVPAMIADHYPIVVFGDSFTEGPNVAMPYPDKIAETLGVPVQNLGYRAYGPQENAAVALGQRSSSLRANNTGSAASASPFTAQRGCAARNAAAVTSSGAMA